MARSKKDKEYLDNLTSLGCVVCFRLTGLVTPAEVHHIRTGQGTSTRASDREAIPLCPRHHRNGGYGEAYHAGSKIWQQNFGTEIELLEYTTNRYKEIYG